MAEQNPTSLSYFAALQEILKLQQDILTKVLPHSGERGSNTEEYFRDFLRRTLPKRYSIGTGFVICSTPDVKPSAQTDIIIHDEFVNSPLFRELAASVFPVETVYATIEIKGNLARKDLKQCVDAIARVRRLAKEKRYIGYDYQKHKNKRVLAITESADTLAPRTFVVAYNTTFTSQKAFSNAWVKALQANRDAHLHGCVVLSKDWYVSQFAFMKNATVINERGHGLVRFLTGLLTGITSMNIGLANMNRYFNVSSVSPLAIDPQEEPPVSS